MTCRLFQIVLKRSTPAQVTLSKCSCTAGTGICSHIIAVLYTVAHLKVLELKVIPPVITKTSLPQQWHVPSRTKGIFSQPVTDLVVQNPNPASKCKSAKTDLSSNENDMCKGQKRNCVKQKLYQSN